MKIDKQDTYGAEVPGAELSISGKDKNGNDVEFKDGDIELGKDAVFVKKTGTAASWISGTSATEIKLTDGNYTLSEIAAPTGFVVATDIVFEIVDGKVVSVDGKATSDQTIIMIDEAIVTTTTTADVAGMNLSRTTTTTTTATTTTFTTMDNDEVSRTTTTTAETTTTTEDTTTTTVPATTTVTTTKQATTTKAKATTNSPNTGVKSISAAFAILALAAGSAFAARRGKRNDD